MIAALTSLFFLYLVALHTSMAAMEVFAWLLFVVIVGYKVKAKSKFEFPLIVPLALLCGVVAVSLFANPTYRTFWFQMGFFRWIFLLWAYYWGLSIVWSPEFEKRLVKLWLFMIIVVGTYSIFQFFTGYDIFRHTLLDGGRYRFARATAFFNNALTLCYSIGTSMFAVAIVAFKKTSKTYTWIAVAFGMAALAATQSRGAWLGALLVAGLYLCFERRRWLYAFIPMAIIATIGLGQFSSRMESSIQLQIDHSSSERLHIWQGYWAIFKDHPLLGVGIFQGDKYLPEYYKKLDIVEPFVSHAHDVPLQWAAGAGIFSLILYVWISLWFLLAAWRLRKETPWGWGLLLAQLFWQFGGLTQADFFDAEVNHLIVFTWALTLLLTLKVHRKPPPVAETA